MKMKNFKLRNLESGLDSISHIKIRTEHQNLPSPTQSRSLQPNHTFRQLIDTLKTFMNDIAKSQKKIDTPFRESMQPRDRQMIYELPEIIQGSIQPANLKRWIAKIFKNITSSAFHFYSTKQMNFDQAKVFCSQNIFKNLALLNKKYALSPQELQIIDSHISNGVLDYLAAKYPLTESNQVNKKLQKIVHQTDNIQAINNNYMYATKVQFEYRQDENYNDLIMQLLNQVMELLQLPSQKHMNYYQDFQAYMTSIFQKVYDLQWMKNSKIIDRQQAATQQQRSKAENHHYKQSVKQYTHFLIGRKIPQNTQKYTDKEIQSKNMTIKSPTILRILTKWCEQLWQKFDESSYFTNRSDNIKILKGNKINVYLPWLRRQTDKLLQAEKEEIRRFMKEISENNYEMQSKILEKQCKTSGGEYIDQLEKIAGKFSNKIVKNIHSYVIFYLNKLIHSLMKVSKKVYQSFELWKSPDWQSAPNLLSFKVGDIIRCKCSSKQKQILRIYTQLQKLSKQQPQKFKIVRVKNRLKSGTNDILINFKFNNKILCEVQLAVKAEKSEFIKCSNMFHHYLYELQRSNFGCLTQLCSIWNNIDQRSKVYDQLIEQQYLHLQKTQHVCSKLKKKIELVHISKPFICSECNKAYFHNNYLKTHKKCAGCEYFICSNCQIDQSTDDSLKFQYLRDHAITEYATRRIKQNQSLPSLGLCIFLQSKVANLQTFQLYQHDQNKKDYIVGKLNNQIYQLGNIKTPKLNKIFRQKHLIFQLKQNQLIQNLRQDEITFYIYKETTKLNYKKQKQSISLMEATLSTQECREILSVGTTDQKAIVKNLFLSDNCMTEIPFEAKDFPNLEWLTLSRNSLTTYQGIQGLQRLKILFINSLKLSTIPSNVFKITALEQLCVTNNQITQISSQIVNLKNLSKLFIERNKIQALPEVICDCHKLQQLNLQQNLITELPQSISKLQNLRVLILRSNKLKSAPNQIGALKKLATLNLSLNQQLQTLPQAFSQLQSLQILSLTNTGINRLPIQIQKLSKLNELYISQTKIQTFPQNITKLPQLQEIYASNLANLKSLLPILQLQNLKALVLSKSNIETIPSEISHLKSLEILDISQNKLTQLDNILVELKSLKKLQAKANEIGVFPNLCYLKKLTHIDLSNNKITQITSQSLLGTTNIQQFLFNYNSIQVLPAIFRQCSRIQKLSLFSNKLTSLFNQQLQTQLSLKEYSIWPNLIQIKLGSNNLHYIPQFIFKCSTLKYMQAEKNNLTKISPKIKQLKNLAMLSVSSNQIAVIPAQLQSLPKIQNLNFSNNLIKVIPQFIKNYRCLKYFWVNGASVEEIECLDWIIQYKYSISFNALAQLADKLKYRKKAEQQKQT